MGEGVHAIHSRDATKKSTIPRESASYVGQTHECLPMPLRHELDGRGKAKMKDEGSGKLGTDLIAIFGQ